MFRIPGRPRVLRSSRGCYRYCRESKQSSSETASCYPERSWKRRSTDHFRINGFTFVETEYDPYTNEVKEISVNLILRASCKS